ncbi:Aldehyde dehydrogenase domain-containing protein [Hirschfeldia incana]|nr:Aldehyde dehydrogenase domain-containing protein [Hirschfeldia incana]KAJ0236401.1 Aldehyde dehydrogenase domain-containing protein [Hirschfeldia incana]
MLRFTYLVEKHSEELAALETWDNGKTYEQVKTSEIPVLGRLFQYYICWLMRRYENPENEDPPSHIVDTSWS